MKSTRRAAPLTTRYGVGGWELEIDLVQRSAQQLFHQLAARAVGRHEPLHALAREHLARVDVPLRVGRYHVEAEELAATLTHASELTDDLAGLALDEPDVVVRQVGDEEILLRLVRRESDAARRSTDAGVLGELELLLEVPLLVGDV